MKLLLWLLLSLLLLFHIKLLLSLFGTCQPRKSWFRWGMNLNSKCKQTNGCVQTILYMRGRRETTPRFAWWYMSTNEKRYIGNDGSSWYQLANLFNFFLLLLFLFVPFLCVYSSLLALLVAFCNLANRINVWLCVCVCQWWARLKLFVFHSVPQLIMIFSLILWFFFCHWISSFPSSTLVTFVMYSSAVNRNPMHSKQNEYDNATCFKHNIGFVVVTT